MKKRTNISAHGRWMALLGPLFVGIFSGCEPQGGEGTSGGPGSIPSDVHWQTMVADDVNGVVLAGYSSSDGLKMWLQTRSPDNTIIDSFKTNEEITPTAVAVDATGIIVGGHDSNGSWTVSEYAKDDGHLLWSVTDLGAGSNSQCSDSPNDIVIDGSAIYLVGNVNVSPCDSLNGYGDGRWKVEGRSRADGKPLWDKLTYGGGWTNFDYAVQAATDATYLYVVGTSAYTSTPFVLNKVDKLQGTFAWAMGVNVSNEKGGTFALDGQDIYTASGGTSGDVDEGWSVQKRSAADGANVWEVDHPADTPRHRITLGKGSLYLAAAGQPIQKISKDDGSVSSTGATALPKEVQLFFSETSVYTLPYGTPQTVEKFALP
jgi:hypothetical protein